MKEEPALAGVDLALCRLARIPCSHTRSAIHWRGTWTNTLRVVLVSTHRDVPIGLDPWRCLLDE